MRVHYRRQVKGQPSAQWVHCGRPLATVQSTRVLEDVTCRTCRAYIAKYWLVASIWQFRVNHPIAEARGLYMNIAEK